MNKNIFLFMLMAAQFFFAVSQTTSNRGIINAKTNNQTTVRTGKTYALIIGINYTKRKNFDHLNYAVSDAKLMKTFLQSGEFIDSLEDKFIKCIIDSEATSAKLWYGFNWLENSAKSGDNAIIYFAGHGIASGPELGFLMAYDAPDVDDPSQFGFQGGAIPIYQLKATIEKLRAKGIVSFLITDACRDNEKGDDSLHYNFENIMESNKGEIQFTSCSKNQSSQENIKWGGGHGLFTYYLVKGLTGAADEEGDKNGNVSLSELEDYVKKHVRNESRDMITNEPKQDPYIHLSDAYNQYQPIAYTKPAKKIIDELKEGNLLATNQRGFTKDSSLLFQIFKEALDKKLFFPEQENNVYLIMKDIQENYSEDVYHDAMQEYIIRLLNDAQIRVNKYFEGVDSNFTDAYFETGARELNIALGMMPKDHPLYKTYNVNRLFMEARSMYGINSEFKMANQKLDSAIAIDSNLAYLYQVKGLFAQWNRDYTDAIKYYQKSSLLKPDWAFPVNGIANCYMDIGEYDKARKLYMQSVADDSLDYFSLNNLGVLFETRFRNYDSAIFYYKRSIAVNPRYPLSLRNVAYVYGQLHQYPKALEIYKQAINIDSTDENTWNSMGYFYYLRKSYTEAISCFKKAISINPYYSYSIRNLAATYEDLKQNDVALVWYKKAITNDPQNSDNWNDIGVFYFAKQDYDNALTSYKKAISIAKSGNALVLRNLGKLYEALHKYQLALSTYHALIKLDSVNTDNWNQLGLFYFNRKQYDSAIIYYKKAIAIDSAYSYSLRNLAEVYSLTHRDAEAEAIYKLATVNDPTNASNWNDLGVFYFGRKKYDLASNAYKKALSINPQYSLVMQNFANVYDANNDSVQALSLYRKAVDVDPDNCVNYNELGAYFVGKKNYDSAILYFNKAVALNPQYSLSIRNLGFCYENKKQDNLALAQYRQATIVDSLNTTNWNELGSFFYNRKKYDTARVYYNKALSIDPEFVTALINLAGCYQNKKNETEAEKIFRRALADDSNCSQCWNGIGAYFSYQKNYDSAILYFQKAIALNPQYSLSIRNLAFCYEKKNQDALALAQYRLATTVDSLNTTNWNELGSFFYNRKKYDTARVYYNKALSIDPGYITAFINLAASYQNQKNDKEAQKIYRRAIAADSTCSQCWNELGAYFYEERNYDTALVYFKKAASFTPDYTLALRNIAQSYQNLHNEKEAIKTYRLAIASDSSCSPCWKNLGVIFFDKKNYDSAIFYFKKAVSITPDYNIGLINLGQAYYYNKNDKNALQAFRRSVVVDSLCAECWNWLGTIYYNSTKNNDSAAYCYKKAIRIDSVYTLSLRNLGMIYEDQNNDSMAMIMYARAIRSDSSNYEIKYKFASFFYSRKKYDSALVWFKKLLPDTAYRSVGIRNMARCYLGLKNDSMMMQSIREAVLVDPSTQDGWCWYSLGEYFRKQKQKQTDDSAFYYYDKGIKLNPYYAWNYYGKGLMLDDKKDYKNSVQYYLKAATLDSTYGTFAGNCGYAYLYDGNFKMAHQYFQKEIALDSNDYEGYYDEACAYSREKNLNSGMEYLKKALDKKFADLDHIQKDEDLTNLRQNPEFMELLKKYFPKELNK